MNLVVTCAFGEKEVGEVLNDYPDDLAKVLIDNGYAAPVNDKSEDDENADAEGDAEVAEDDTKSVDALLGNKLDAAIAKAVGKLSTTVTNRKPTFTVAAQPKDKFGGFKSMGDYLRCMYYAAKGDHGAQRKLSVFKAATGQNEGSSADGLALVPQEWADSVFEKARSAPFLFDMTDKRTTKSNVLNVPIVNDTSRADGSRPLRSYLVAEAGSYTASKIVYGNVQLTAYKYGILAAATEELLADNYYNLEAQITKEFGDEIRFRLNQLLISGTGSSQPTGILNTNALVTVAANSNTASKSVSFPDFAEMWGRLYSESRKNAVWVVNQQLMSKIVQLAFDPSATTNKVSAYGITYNAQDEFPLRMFGRPIIEVEAASGAGAAGDVILADFSQMVTMDKPVEIAVSPHVNFTTGEVLYRCFVRFDSKALWTAPLTAYSSSGTFTVSPFVTVATRGTT